MNPSMTKLPLMILFKTYTLLLTRLTHFCFANGLDSCMFADSSLTVTDTGRLRSHLQTVQIDARRNGHQLGMFLAVKGRHLTTYLSFCSRCYYAISVTPEGVESHLETPCPKRVVASPIEYV